MLDDDYIYSWMRERDGERKIKRKKREIYNHIRLFDAVINTFSCIMGILTGSKKFYIAALTCCISYIIVTITEKLDN